jgi:putative endonuclease
MWGILQRFRTSRSVNSRPIPHLELGEKGERLAAEFLKRLSYRIVATNFVGPIGYSRNGRQVTGEIDIIAYDESSAPFNLVFIEIKTRTSSDIAAPEAAVDLRKQRQIVRTSRIYRRLMSVEDQPYRYDVVSIVLAPNKNPQLTLLRGYFSELKFERSGWLTQKNERESGRAGEREM